ncbi:hypothetical protein [uncultured Tateyamaria sp.]|uniref:hypothetical protein n=1 Tax=uncultured Tateyamaria sp. TaxID=455651 RepID=UPI0026396E81|nr:hypothetical protein [uncultured Tateyamaria sp.]
MIDPLTKVTMLEELIEDLDPRVNEVAIAHLRDAIDALNATSRDRPTRYARSADLVDGAVSKKGTVRLFK